MSRKLDVLVVGELNVDLLMYGIPGAPELGKEILADRMTLTMGSSSAIFAVNLASLGSKVGFVGRLGHDVFGELVIESLKEGGVDTSRLIVKDDHITGATVALGWGKDRAMVTHKGAMDFLTAQDVTDEMLAEARHLHVSSFFLQDGLRPGIVNLFERAHEQGLTTSFDTQWDPEEEWRGVRDVLPQVDIFLPNQAEAMAMTGAFTASEAAALLHEAAKSIVVKCGNQGAMMIDSEGHSRSVKPHKVDVVDEVGAGDTFDAAYVHARLKGLNEKACLAFANAVAAFSVTAPGGTTALKNRSELEAWLKTSGIPTETLA